MNDDIQIVMKEISSRLSRLGFKKRGKTWDLHVNDLHHIVHIQRSSWGELYFFRYGIYSEALARLYDEEILNPKEPDSHISVNIRFFIQNEKKLETNPEEALDFTKDVPMEKRISILDEVICLLNEHFLTPYKETDDLFNLVKVSLESNASAALVKDGEHKISQYFNLPPKT